MRPSGKLYGGSENVNVDVFTVAGTSGIGKSIFLLWLLIRRLALKLPTVLQVAQNEVILFYEGGAYTLTQPTDLGPYDALCPPTSGPNSRIWALIDSNYKLKEIPTVVRDSGSFFMVNAASIGSESPAWMRKFGSRRFYMNLWSVDEILQARSLLGSYTGRQLLYLHHNFGASPRALSLFADDPDIYETELLDRINAIKPGGLSTILRKPESIKYSCFIIVTKPQPDHRDRPTRMIAFESVFKLLWDDHIRSRIQVMAEVYDIFSSGLSFFAAEAAGWVFKYRMHQLLSEGREIQIYPVCGQRNETNIIYDDYTATRSREGVLDFKLVESGENIVPDVWTTPLKKNAYYRPKFTTLPVIDSLFLYKEGRKKPVILMFQIIQAATDHDVNLKGLRQMDNLKLPRGFQDARKIFVVVTPDLIQPKINVPIDHFGKKNPSPEEFEVYHCPINVNQIFSE